MKWSFLLMFAVGYLGTAGPVPLAPSSDRQSSEARLCADTENLASGVPIMLQTMEGAFLSVGDASGLSVDESCCPPDTQFVLTGWRGLQVLRSTSLGLVLGMRSGEAVWGKLPGEEHGGLHEDEVVDVVEDLVASRTVSLRFGRDASQLLCVDDARVKTCTVAAAGLGSVLVVVDDQLRRHLEHLNTEGYTVVKILGEEEAREARDVLDRVVALGTAHGFLYSNGYQVRVPNVAVHDVLLSDLLGTQSQKSSKKKLHMVSIVGH